MNILLQLIHLDLILFSAQLVKCDPFLIQFYLIEMCFFAGKRTYKIGRRNYFFYSYQFIFLCCSPDGYTNDTLHIVWLDSPLGIDRNTQLPGYTLRDHLLSDCTQTYTSGTFPCHEIKLLLRPASWWNTW